MTAGTEQDAEDLRRAVESATRHDVCDEVHAIYRELDSAISARKPRCDASGRCCDFDAYGHRLYVTTLELATFRSDLSDPVHIASHERESAPVAAGRVTLPVLVAGGGGCVYQIDRLCSVHGIRPFGCRIYFCDPAADAWMQEQYERFHARLKALHHQFGVSYFYVEWRWALAALGGGAESEGKRL